MSRANGSSLCVAPFPGNDVAVLLGSPTRVELDFYIGQCFLCRAESKGKPVRTTMAMMKM